MRILALLLTLTAAALAQNLNTFKGQVTDPSAAAVPGAIVRVTPTSGKEQRKNTDSSGNFEFRNIPYGKYTVRIEKPGFTMYQVDELQVSGVTQFNIQLTINSQAQIIDVQSEIQGVSVDPLMNAGALVLKEADLEAFSDDPDILADELMALAGPGAGPNGGQLFIDGFSGGKLPPKSSIREVRVNSNPYSAEYDRIGFGRIEILTKPGTDKFRGDVHYGFSDSALNSRNPFAPTRAPFRSQLWGGRLSGPITAKKASFSIDIEGRNVDENSIVNATILSPSFLPTLFQQTVVTPQRRFTITNRVDYAIDDKNTLVARYTFSPTGSDNQGVGQFSLPTRAYNSTDTDHTVQITETSILSTRAINETRFQYLHSNTQQLGDNKIFALSVQDAFSGGGPQNGSARTIDERFELTNITSFLKGTHSIKVGGRARRTNQESYSPNNFGGSYTFAGGVGPVLDTNNNPVLNPDGTIQTQQTTSLERYRRTLVFQAQGLGAAQVRALGGGASQFSINLGDPLAAVQQFDIGLFATWDWRYNPRTTISGGLRWEDQTNIANHNNFAPRVGLAYALDGGGKKPTKTVLRLGGGLFYDRVDDNLTLNALRFNGVNQVSYTVRDPDTFPSIPTAAQLTPFRNSLTIRELYSGIRTPYLLQSSVGLERTLPRNTRIATNYIFTRGVHVMRSRNINTPFSDGLRPYGPSGNIFLNEATGFSRQHQLMTNFSTRFSSRVNLFGYYSLNFARSDTDAGGPANPYNLAGEYGPSRQDIRNRFTLMGSIAAKWGVSLNPNFSINSGSPFNITTGRDTNGDTLFTERPAFATDPFAPGVLRTPYGNFITNPGANDKIIPRNYGRGPINYSLNMRLSKSFGFGPEVARAAGGGRSGGGGGGPRGGGGGMRGGMRGGGGDMGGGPDGGGGGVSRKYSVNFSVSARNLLNTVNLAAPNGNLTSPYFGVSTATANGGGFGGGGGGGGGGGSAANRRIDLSARFTF